jgi:ubiquinone/menaquinone biosynthesis C-methylase UbiE
MRAALNRINAADVVTTERNHRTAVSPLSVAEIPELFKMVSAPEGQVVELGTGTHGWLLEQSRVLRPTTDRLLRAAGVSEGMRVLDIYCGRGDVAMIAADRVGPGGSVTGIDRSVAAIRYAEERAAANGYVNIEYRLAGLADADLSSSLFDAVVCRHVVIGQREPVRFLRSASRLVRSGGILALHEMDMSRDIRSSPPLPMLRVVNETIHRALERSGVIPDAGGRFADLFDEADLPSPHLFSESIIATGEDRSVFGLVTGVLRSLMPHLTTAEVAEIGIETLETRLRQDARELRSQVEFIPQICAWVRL